MNLRLLYPALFVGVMAVSTAAVLVRLSEAPAVVLAFYRLALALVILAPVALGPRRAQLAAMSRRDIFLSVASGCFLGLHYLVWFESLRLTTVASSTVLVTTQPVWVLLIGYILWRQWVPRRAVYGLILALAGVYIIGSHDLRLAGGHFAGDMLAVAGAILISCYLVIGQQVRPRVGLFPYVLVVYATGAAVLAAAALAGGVSLSGYPIREWALFAALAIGPTIVGHTLFNYLLRYVPASTVAITILGEPVGASLLALMVLQEVPAPMQIAGGVLVLLGVGTFLRARAAAHAAAGTSPPVAAP